MSQPGNFYIKVRLEKGAQSVPFRVLLNPSFLQRRDEVLPQHPLFSVFYPRPPSSVVSQLPGDWLWHTSASYWYWYSDSQNLCKKQASAVPTLPQGHGWQRKGNLQLPGMHSNKQDGRQELRLYLHTWNSIHASSWACIHTHIHIMLTHYIQTFTDTPCKNFLKSTQHRSHWSTTHSFDTTHSICPWSVCFA